MRVRSILYPALGLAFAVAGADKLMGDAGYDRMFRRFGWPRGAQRLEASAEVLGGLLIAAPPTRRLGGIVLAGASGAVLASEVKGGTAALAVPRLLLLAAALTAVMRRE